MIDIDWSSNEGAIWRSFSKTWHPVSSIYAPDLSGLINIDNQKAALLENTAKFVKGKLAQHSLLWGARGTGKSSLVKAVTKTLTDQNLRIIQVDKKDLNLLPDLIDSIRTINHYKFIIFLDDLSFTHVSDEYQSLKSCIEGNIEKPADNVLFYVTSNKKHLISQTMSENLNAHVVSTTLREGDITEDKMALSDRFGLMLSFYSISQDEYFDIINKELGIDIENNLEMRRAAIQYASQKGVRNARTAQQFSADYK